MASFLLWLGTPTDSKPVTVNKAEVSRRTGISKSRLTQVTSNASAKLRADELYLIALAINADPGEMFRGLREKG